jgi:hypothetical protein
MRLKFKISAISNKKIPELPYLPIQSNDLGNIKRTFSQPKVRFKKIIEI